MSLTRIVKSVRKGEVVTGQVLTSYAAGINSLNRRFSIIEQEIQSGERFAQTDQQTDNIDDRAKLPTTPNRVFVEVNRQTDTVRVENPNDPEQYVDVERIRFITMRNLFGEDMILAFDDS